MNNARMRSVPKVFIPKPTYQDKRGVITNILEFAPFEHLAVITCYPGALRGNHYHPVDEQWIYMLKGKAYVRTEDVTTGEQQSYTLEAGQLEYMPSGIAHVYYFPIESLFLNITPNSRRTANNEERDGATLEWVVWGGPQQGEESTIGVVTGDRT